MILADASLLCPILGVLLVSVIFVGVIILGSISHPVAQPRPPLPPTPQAHEEERRLLLQREAELRAARDATEKRERELMEEHERKIEEGDREIELQRKTNQEELTKVLQQVRDGAEERYRSSFSAKSIAELDERLREAQLMGSHMGKVLTVRFFASPRGWFGIEWMVDPSIPATPRVQCKRDDETVFVEYGYRNSYVGTLPRGREFLYRFKVHDGKRCLERDFKFVVEIPTERQWQRKLNGVKVRNTAGDRKRQLRKTVKGVIEDEKLWEGARQEGHKLIEQSPDEPLQKMKRKAKLDLKLQEEREKDEDE